MGVSLKGLTGLALAGAIIGGAYLLFTNKPSASAPTSPTPPASASTTASPKTVTSGNTTITSTTKDLPGATTTLKNIVTSTVTAIGGILSGTTLKTVIAPDEAIGGNASGGTYKINGAVVSQQYYEAYKAALKK